MTVENVKRCLLKDLNIIKTREITTNNIDSFEDNRKPFIAGLRSDIHTKIVGTNSSYFDKQFSSFEKNSLQMCCKNII